MKLTTLEASHSDSQQGFDFSLQLFHRNPYKKIYIYMRNLRIKSLRQFYTREMEILSVTNTILENQAELMNEIKSLKKENQQLRCQLSNLLN
ncbi:hypothetical protein ACOSQ4_030484 [Xanthoceras sorbifolium]